MDSKRIFISYPREDRTQVLNFTKALSDAGIDYWIDCEKIDPGDDFAARIRDGLAGCHALLAWYSVFYPQKSYCQKEFAAAWICSQRLTNDVMSRILILNPTKDIDHIAVGELGRQNYLTLADPDRLFNCIRRKLEATSEDFAAVGKLAAPNWYPSIQPSSKHFVGRLNDLWNIHTKLNPSGIWHYENPNPKVQITGMGGGGKSLLAIEYAKRFGAAYPKGIFFLRAYGFDPGKPLDFSSRQKELEDQITKFAIDSGIPVKERDFNDISQELKKKLYDEKEQYLWIVDDLPHDRNFEGKLQDWCAPTANGRTLITTRSKVFEKEIFTIEINMLEPIPAFELLTQNRKPFTPMQKQQAIDLVDALGRHPMALDVAGGYLLKTRSFAELRDLLKSTQVDLLGDLVGGLEGRLPLGHEKSIVITFLESVKRLKKEGLTLLRLACALRTGGRPISLRLIEGFVAHYLQLSKHAAMCYVYRAINQLEQHSLSQVSTESEDRFLTTHALVRYTLLHGDPEGKMNAQRLRKKMREKIEELLLNLEWAAMPNIQYQQIIADYELLSALKTNDENRVGQVVAESTKAPAQVRVKLLCHLACLSKALGHRRKALRFLENGRKLASDLNDSLLVATTLTQAGIVRFHLGNFQQSKAELESARNIFESAQGEKMDHAQLASYGSCLNWLGLLEREVRNWVEAVKLHKAAIKIAKDNGDGPLQAHAIANIGAVHYWRRQYENALKEWKKSLELSKECENEELIAHLLVDVGYMTFLTNRSREGYDEALSYLNDGIDLSIQKGFEENYARGLMNKGSVYFVIGELNKADNLYTQALEIAEARNIVKLAWRIEHNIGNVFRRKNDLEAAKKHYEFSNRSIALLAGQYDTEERRCKFLQHRLNLFRSLILLYLENDDPAKAERVAQDFGLQDYFEKRKRGSDLAELESEEQENSNYNFFNIDDVAYYIETE